MLFGIWVQVIHVSLKHSPEISTRDLQNSQKDSDSGPELCQAHTYWSKLGKGTFISTISFPVKVIFLCITSSVSPLKEWMKPCWVISHPTKLARAPVLGATAPLSGQQTTLHGDFLFSSYSLSLSTFLPQECFTPQTLSHGSVTLLLCFPHSDSHSDSTRCPSSKLMICG